VTGRPHHRARFRLKTEFVYVCASIKLGVMEDHSNRTRLAKLLRFYSSNSDTEMTSLADYIERMKEKQEHIYFIAGSSRKEVETSPFVERLLKKGYEVLYCHLLIVHEFVYLYTVSHQK